MRTYERSGAYLDQCVECRGIFLDRGELERLMANETGAVTATVAQGGHMYPEPRGSGNHGSDPRHGRRKRGWLGDLFD